MESIETRSRCACGCGGAPRLRRSRFLPGHASRKGSTTVTCRVCDSQRTVTVRQANAQARKNKHFDVENGTTICRSCVMKKWHQAYKKTHGVHGYKEMLGRRMRRARRLTPTGHRQLAVQGRKGQRDSTETVCLRVLRRYAGNVGQRRSFFLCANCGKLSSCHVNEAAAFGLGCLAEMRRTPAWGDFIRRRKYVDPACRPPWSTQGRRTNPRLRFDLTLILQHYVIEVTVRELANRHSLTEIAIKKALQRGRAVLPERWGHVFPKAKEPLRGTATANFIPSFPQ